ncbi:hypothetical protein BJX99DRAFT_257899 [Aspergillus californicus]
MSIGDSMLVYFRIRVGIDREVGADEDHEGEEHHECRRNSLPKPPKPQTTFPLPDSMTIQEGSTNAFSLVQDPFGNYVVQYILDLAEAHFTEPFCHAFRGNISANARPSAAVLLQQGQVRRRQHRRWGG